MKKLVLILCASLALLVTGCGQEIVVPPSDPTPPSVTLGIWLDGEEIALRPESEDVCREVRSDDPINLVAHGRDADGGVSSVAIYGSIEWTCNTDFRGSRLAQKKHEEIASVNQSEGRSGETAWTDRYATLVVELGDCGERCQPGWELESLTGSLSATATNTHGTESKTSHFRFALIQ